MSFSTNSPSSTTTRSGSSSGTNNLIDLLAQLRSRRKLESATKESPSSDSGNSDGRRGLSSSASQSCKSPTSFKTESSVQNTPIPPQRALNPVPLKKSALRPASHEDQPKASPSASPSYSIPLAESPSESQKEASRRNDTRKSLKSRSTVRLNWNEMSALSKDDAPLSAVVENSQSFQGLAADAASKAIQYHNTETVGVDGITLDVKKFDGNHLLSYTHIYGYVSLHLLLELFCIVPGANNTNSTPKMVQKLVVMINIIFCKCI